jgi:hypothetical protein
MGPLEWLHGEKGACVPNPEETPKSRSRTVGIQPHYGERIRGGEYMVHCLAAYRLKWGTFCRLLVQARTEIGITANFQCKNWRKVGFYSFGNAEDVLGRLFLELCVQTCKYGQYS